jgi:hypothetical protein
MDLKKYLPNKKAASPVLIGSIMAIMIGSLLILVTYLVLSSLITAASIGITCTNTTTLVGCSPFYASFNSNITVITQALTIVGVALIVAGVSGIIYMLMSVAGGVGGKRGQ